MLNQIIIAGIVWFCTTISPAHTGLGFRLSLVIGHPDTLARYWHDQRWEAQDNYACALYAQASVLEALGYDFPQELAAARELGLRDGWYAPGVGTIGLGQPLRAHGITFDVFGTSLGGKITRRDALIRLVHGLLAGDYVLTNLDATQLTYYRGSPVIWHTLWVTGIRLSASGPVIIANDSYRGAAAEYPLNEFIDAWGQAPLNYYAIFVHPTENSR